MENNAPLVFGYDQYLGFPVNDPKIINELNAHRITVKSYPSMDKMVVDLKHHRLAMAFIPAAAQYFLPAGLNYSGFASTTTSLHHQDFLISYLLVTQESGINSITQLQGKNLYYLNGLCTTSYFAPMIYFHSQGIDMLSYFSELIPVHGFHQQLPALMKGKTNATMLWTDIWDLSPQLAKMTRIIGEVKDLPTPVMLMSNHINLQLKNELYKFFMSYHKPDNVQWGFEQFIPYQTQKNKTFMDEIREAS